MNLICIMTAQGNGMVFIVAGLDKAVFSGLYNIYKTMKTTISNDVLSAAIAAVRTKSPLVHSITNYVVMNNSANALLSVGASPVMAHWKDEMEEMTAIAVKTCSDQEYTRYRMYIIFCICSGSGKRRRSDSSCCFGKEIYRTGNHIRSRI